jgi:hypothetical protein
MMRKPAAAPQSIQMGQRHNGDDNGIKRYSGTKTKSHTGMIKYAMNQLDNTVLPNNNSISSA